MTERDTRSDQTVDTDGQRSADPATPGGTPPPAVPSAFGSAPAGWQPSVSSVTSDATAPAGPAPVTGTPPLPAVPSRRSLRGKPPVSTAAIPVVPKPVAGAPTAPSADTPVVPPTPTTRPVAPSNPPVSAAAGAVAPTAAAAAPATSAAPATATAATPVAPTAAVPAAPAAPTAAAPAAAAAPTTAVPAAADAPTAAAPATRLSGSVLPRRTAGNRATVAEAAPAATGTSADDAPDATGTSAAPPAVSFDQTLAGPDPSSAVPAPPAPTPPPAWHPITGATQVVPAADAPWKPVTGAQPVVPAAPPRAVATPPSGRPEPATRPQSVPTGTPSPPVPPGSGAADHSEEPVSDTRRSRRGLWITLIVVGVLVLGGAGAAAWYLRDRDQPAAEQEVVQAPSPTSALTAIDRTATTAFAANLPATVLQYALTATADDAEWTGAGALESYLDTYADEAGDQLTVHSGQWATAEEAAAQQAALAAAVTGEVLSTGPVTVAGADTGAVTIVDLGDGTGSAVWSNGTAVFVLTAPVADVSNAFAAYPV